MFQFSVLRDALSWGIFSKKKVLSLFIPGDNLVASGLIKYILAILDPFCNGEFLVKCRTDKRNFLNCLAKDYQFIFRKISRPLKLNDIRLSCR